MSKTGFVVSGRYLEHNTGQHHPECAGRISAICHRMGQVGLAEHTLLIEPKEIDLEWVRKVHSPAYIDEFEYACENQAGFIDSPECPVCTASFDIARLSTGGLIEAIDAVMEGRVDNAFCAVRPPGHHAERAHAMGFCFFNNVAIAAEYLREKYELTRVAILDWDVHHGNGTQHHFERDPAVFYISIHQDPRTIFPGTGFAHETGIGEGEGTTLNIPVMPADEDPVYQKAFEEKILPALSDYKPDFLLLSAGFDAHHRDPLSYVMLSTEAFGWMTARVREIADACCQGRLVSALEGGYDFEGLAECVQKHIETLID